MKKSRVMTAVAGVLLLASWAYAAQMPTTNVWDGVYSEAQAAKGQAAYSEYCSGCHMPDLSGGGPAPALSGEAFVLQNEKKTVGDLFIRIKTTMPPGQPDQLGDDMYLDVVAHLLKANGFPAGQSALSAGLDALKQIRIVSKSVAGKDQGTE